LGNSTRKWLGIAIAALIFAIPSYACIVFNPLVDLLFRVEDIPCKDPQETPGFEVVYSQCKDTVAFDIAPDGRTMVILDDSGYSLVDLTTMQATLLFQRNETPEYLNSNFLVTFTRGYFIDRKQFVDIDTIDIETDPNWEERLSQSSTIYELFWLVFAEIQGESGEDVFWYRIAYGSQAKHVVVRELRENGFEVTEVIPNIQNCTSSSGCESHNQMLIVRRNQVKDQEGNLIVDLKDYTNEGIFVAGWSYDDRYIYFYFQIVGGPSYGFPSPHYPAGVARYEVPAEYWNNEQP
jgi:hypothetical protein